MQKFHEKNEVIAIAALLMVMALVQSRGRAAEVEAAQHPNVVFILADDLGWSDTTLYGTTDFYRTPNIARLAQRGMTFTRAYSSSPLCSPTRASILTGLSPARHGITTPGCHLPQVLLDAQEGEKSPPGNKSISPQSVTRLKTEYYTLAEAFQDSGYATAHFGKWHLGAEPYSPLQHGFDVDVPHWPGPGPAGSYVAPWKFKDFDHDPDIPNEHLEDRMAKEAVEFLEQHADGPFFLNYWMFSVHAPFDAKKDLIQKYRRVVDPSDPQRCPTYAAMIESMDDAVGTLLDTLDRLQIAERTIIVFASDNGGNMYNEVEGERPTSNTPLRGGKATMFEGGVRTPCCVIWPNEIEANSRSDEIIQSSDFYPTLVEMTGIKIPQDQRFDGIDITPALKGKSLQREAIFTYFPHDPKVPDWIPPSVSVHRGDWKLIRIFYGGENGAHRWKLFNLKQDIGEKNDLSSKHPELVKELDQLIDDHLNDCGAVRPIPNPDFDPAKYQPDMEGVQLNEKKAGKSKPKPRVAGWSPDNQCELKIVDGALQMKSLGGDPHMSFHLAKPIEPQALTVKMEISSTASGNAQLFWQEQGVKPAYFRDRSVMSEIENDGQFHQVQFQFTPSKQVLEIRFDPARSQGLIKIRSMILCDGAGHRLFDWKFD